MSSKRGDPRNTRAYRKRRLVVLARDGYVCRYCNSSENLTVDHVIPIVKGGDPMDMENMVVACKPCNSRKGSRSEAVFLARTNTPPVFPSHTSPMQSEIHQDSPFIARPVAK